MSVRRGLVTSSAGLIGLHLYRRLLADGFDVVVLDKLSRHGTDRELDIFRPHLRFPDADVTPGLAAVPGGSHVVFRLVGYRALTTLTDRLEWIFSWHAQRTAEVVA